ncbi:MAG: 16S rRNA (cytidine(1402)-2'-O)-methyltransferase [Ignavibacteriaceae bacterium]|jgi:16S rRNA (cytidine1402-2'-O)-methyltransferase|nr:16S rRNA (cytidine(1402)-2'-O)-methyltransferase [Ignavibacteriaceae bacterium]
MSGNNGTILYLVSTPIGNPDDITLRALNVLREVPFIIVEEYKEARRLLSKYDIEKELICLNEHNEQDEAGEILAKVKIAGSAALISDCGTPLFSDPGKTLVSLAINSRIKIVPVPGASSLLPALIGSGFLIDTFYYSGWLSPKKDIRQRELSRLKNIKDLLVIMETPYRLGALIKDVRKIFGDKTPAVVAFDLTLPEEKYIRGNLEYIDNYVQKDKLKGEFVLLINNK